MAFTAQALMISRLAAAHRQGRLVPFLGAGMSVPSCPGWEDFICGLEQQVFGQPSAARTGRSDSEALIRRANAAVRQLRLRGDPPFPGAVSSALKVQPPRDTPAQTKSLARLYWPLVLTSNYDGLFLKTWNELHAGAGAEMEVLGRSAADCRQVLTSLHASRPPILWALQGYVEELRAGSSRRLLRFLAIDQAAQKLLAGRAGPQLLAQLGALNQQAGAAAKRARSLVEAKQAELREQLVVGHEEYRRVTHTEPQFRRAFAEIFRARSFLFVGSSLADQYLLNLFGETLEIFGANPFPHYALVLKGTTDPEFLRTRLNTFVYEYDKHEDLPRLLDELYDAVENDSARVRTWSYAVARSVRSVGERRASDIHIVRGDLPLPDAGECVALGVSVGDKGQITLDRSTEAVIARMNCIDQVRKLAFGADDRIRRVPGQPLLLFAVTTEQGKQDLRQYSRSIAAVLDEAATAKFRLVRTRLPLADRSSTWLSRLGARLGGIFGLWQQVLAKDFRQRFWLMEVIRAYGRWRRAEGNEGLLELSVHLTDQGILFDMSTGRIDPVELLMCDDLRFTVEVEHGVSTLVSESYQCVGTMTLGALAQDLMLLRATDARSSPELWLVEVEPSPTGVPHLLALSEASALDTSLAELGVVTDSVLRFVRLDKPVVEAPAAVAAPAATVTPASPPKKSRAKRKQPGKRASNTGRVAVKSGAPRKRQ